MPNVRSSKMKKNRPTTLLQWIGWRPLPVLLTYKQTILKPLAKAEALTITRGSALKFMCRNSGPAKSSRRAGVMPTLVKALVRRIKFLLLAALSRLNACAKRRAGRQHAEKPDDQNPDHCRAVQRAA